jgi:hypothetical protein
MWPALEFGAICDIKVETATHNYRPMTGSINKVITFHMELFAVDDIDNRWQEWMLLSVAKRSQKHKERLPSVNS